MGPAPRPVKRGDAFERLPGPHPRSLALKASCFEASTNSSEASGALADPRSRSSARPLPDLGRGSASRPAICARISSSAAAVRAGAPSKWTQRVPFAYPAPRSAHAPCSCAFTDLGFSLQKSTSCLELAFATDWNKRCMLSSYGRPSTSRYHHNEGRPAVCAVAVLQF